MAEDQKPRTIRAVERASAIIHMLEDKGEMSMNDIVAGLDISKSTVHTYLHTLSQEGFIAKHEGEYRLSLRYLSFGEQVKNRIEIYETVTKEIDKLAEQTGERVQFAQLEKNMVVYVYLSKGANAIGTTISIGEYVYPHSVAAGKAIIAYLPDHRVDAIIEENGLPKQTENTITDREELKSCLDEVRKGICLR